MKGELLHQRQAEHSPALWLPPSFPTVWPPSCNHRRPTPKWEVLNFWYHLRKFMTQKLRFSKVLKESVFCHSRRGRGGRRPLSRPQLVLPGVDRGLPPLSQAPVPPMLLTRESKTQNSHKDSPTTESLTATLSRVMTCGSTQMPWSLASHTWGPPHAYHAKCPCPTPSPPSCCHGTGQSTPTSPQGSSSTSRHQPARRVLNDPHKGLPQDATTCWLYITTGTAQKALRTWCYPQKMPAETAVELSLLEI